MIDDREQEARGEATFSQICMPSVLMLVLAQTTFTASAWPLPLSQFYRTSIKHLPQDWPFFIEDCIYLAHSPSPLPPPPQKKKPLRSFNTKDQDMLHSLLRAVPRRKKAQWMPASLERFLEGFWDAPNRLRAYVDKHIGTYLSKPFPWQFTQLLPIMALMFSTSVFLADGFSTWFLRSEWVNFKSLGSQVQRSDQKFMSFSLF